MKKPSKKQAFYGLIVVIPILVVAVALLIPNTIPKNQSIEVEGTVEIKTVPYFAQVSGEVVAVHVAMGQTVKQGDILLEISDTDALFNISQIEVNLTKAKSYLRELESIAGNSSVSIAQNNVNIQKQSLGNTYAIFENAKKNYTDIEALFNEGIVSENELNVAKEAMDASARQAKIGNSQLSNARSSLTQTLSGKSEQIIRANADIVLAESQLAKANEDLKKYSITADNDGVILELNIDVGNVIIAGTKAVEISKEYEKHLVFYVPEEYISKVEYDKTIEITRTNNKETKKYEGIVKYIDLKGQYTPAESESSANKNKLSFKVKLLLPESCDLRATQKAMASIQ